MMERRLNGAVVRVVQGDITDLEVEAFVYDARPDLVLGSGYGGAIAQRGGPAIQAELKTKGPLEVGQATVSGAGNLKAKHIVDLKGNLSSLLETIFNLRGWIERVRIVLRE